MKTSAIIVLVVLLLVNFALSKYKILVVMEALWEGDVEMYLKLFPEQLGADTEVRLMRSGFFSNFCLTRKKS